MRRRKEKGGGRRRREGRGKEEEVEDEEEEDEDEEDTERRRRKEENTGHTNGGADGHTEGRTLRPRGRAGTTDDCNCPRLLHSRFTYLH